jgi:hypothetical protein
MDERMSPPAIKQFRPGDRVYVRAQQVWLILVAFVMSRRHSDDKTITYGDLAEKMGLPAQAAIGLGRELGIVGIYCTQNGLPALNSIVVNRETGVPGAGVVVRAGKSWRDEQRETLKANWFKFRVPTSGTFRQVWDGQ